MIERGLGSSSAVFRAGLELERGRKPAKQSQAKLYCGTYDFEALDSHGAPRETKPFTAMVLLPLQIRETGVPAKVPQTAERRPVAFIVHSAISF
ncbi:MAG: hypothetical protein L0Y57_10900 [Beijerinckiaceae bacterium]|nr:hypothetical protein [Beijerinckiaceae bacterium]